jgi:hypothetical protein
MEAESSLLELTEALGTVQSASQRFDAAAWSITQARERLMSVADELGAGTQAIAKSLELVRSGIGALEKTDPGKLLAELNRLGGTIATHAKQVGEGISRLALQVSQVRDEHLKVTSERHAEVIHQVQQALMGLKGELEGVIATSAQELNRGVSSLREGMTEKLDRAVTGLREQLESIEAGVRQAHGDATAHDQRLAAGLGALQSEVARLRADARASTARSTWMLIALGILLAALDLWTALR